MQFLFNGSGVRFIRFRMHGKPRLWCGPSFRGLLISIAKEWFRERRRSRFTRALVRSWFKAQE